MEKHLPIEELLYEEEGTTLDFKREAYKFSLANEFEKCEILKDILAFSNAWRRADAYILIGVIEIKGGKSRVVGIEEELDDAQLQQFVNSKTQRPVEFEYRTILFEGVKIGVLRIPPQVRPIFLTKDYGKLKKNVVYLRRGSSTGEANPEEIMDMGRSESSGALEIPALYFEFADRKKRLPMGNSLMLEAIYLDIPTRNQIPRYHEERSNDPFGIASFSMPHADPDYYKDMVLYYHVLKKSTELAFLLRNDSSSVVTDIRVELYVPKKEGVFSFFEANRFPSYPRSHFNPLQNIKPLAVQLSDAKKRKSIELQDLGDSFRIEIMFEKAQPKQTIYSSEVIYLASNQSFSEKIIATIYADNVPAPIKQELTVSCDVTRRDGSLEQIEKIHQEKSTIQN